MLLDIERQFNKNDLSLQKLLFYLEGPSSLFAFLTAQIIDPVSNQKLSGCGVIRLIENCAKYSSKSKEVECIVEFILEACYAPVFEIAANWVKTGQLVDPLGDFFIQEDVTLKKEDLIEDFNSNYWSEKFSIINEYVPALFRSDNLQTMILMTGKYVYTLKECSSQYRFLEYPQIELIYKSGDTSKA